MAGKNIPSQFIWFESLTVKIENYMLHIFYCSMKPHNYENKQYFSGFIQIFLLRNKNSLKIYKTKKKKNHDYTGIFKEFEIID